jgi:hypothetical protein
VKNLPALALALVCTTGFLVAPAADAATMSATATASWKTPTPFTVTNAAGGDISNSVVVVDPVNASDPFDPNLHFTVANINGVETNRVNGWAASLNTSAANPDVFVVSSPNSMSASASGGFATTASWSTFRFTTTGTAQLAFDYSFIDTINNNPSMTIDVVLMKLDANASPLQTIVGGATDPASGQPIPLLSFGTDAGPTFTSALFDVAAGDLYSLTFNVSSVAGTPAPSAVPVPAALPLLGSALAAIAGLSKRRRGKGALI